VRRGFTNGWYSEREWEELDEAWIDAIKERVNRP
jgi:hypothetical protein